LFAYYRGLSLRTRILTLVLGEAVVTAITYRYHYAFPTVPLVVAGLALAVDVFARRVRLLLAVLVGLAQLVAVTFLAYSTSLALALFDSTGISFYLVQTLFLFALLLQIAFSLYTARGRIWLNLLLSSLLLDFSYLLLQVMATGVTSLALPTRILAAGLAALGFMLLYYVVRSVAFHSEPNPSLPPRHLGITTKTGNYLAGLGLTVLPVRGEGLVLDQVAHSSRAVYAVYTLDAEDKLQVRDNTLLVDGQDATDALAQLAVAGKRWARRYRLPNQTLTYVLLAHRAGLQPASRRITVRDRRRPDRVLGTVFLVNRVGFERLLKEDSRRRPLAARVQRRLTRLTQS